MAMRKCLGMTCGASVAGILLLGATDFCAGDLYDEGAQHYESGQLQKAITAYEAFIKEHPDDERAARAQLETADLYGHLGRWEDATNAYAKVVEHYGATKWYGPCAKNRIAEIHYHLADNEKALEAWDELIAEFPQSQYVIRAHYMRGDVYLNRSNDLQRAREEWEEVLAVSPQGQGYGRGPYGVCVIKKIGDVYFDLGMYAKAKEAFEETLAAYDYPPKYSVKHLSWTTPHTFFMLGELLLKEGNKNKAVACYRDAYERYLHISRLFRNYAEWSENPTMVMIKQRLRELGGTGEGVQK